MINSMTGFGRSRCECDGREYIVEIRTVNHKYNDVTVKMSRDIIYLEQKVKKDILEKISRGKVEVYVTFSNYSEKGKNIKVNKQLAKKYIDELRELANENNLKDDISIIELAKLPDILKLENVEDEDLIWNELKTCLSDAINSLLEMRVIEGNRIYEDILSRINIIKSQVEIISKCSCGLIEEYIVKLEERIRELLRTDIIDKTRIAQEVVIYSDKCSIEEELTRLNSHLFQLHKLLQSSVPIGKKLDFLLQEMNREVNTIASKANNLDIVDSVVNIKTELENIREQIQNVE